MSYLRPIYLTLVSTMILGAFTSVNAFASPEILPTEKAPLTFTSESTLGAQFKSALGKIECFKFEK